jgi:hypothetical protein
MRIIVMTLKALNNCIWWPPSSSSSSSLCLSLAEVCSCYFWPPRAKEKKSLLISYHQLSFADQPYSQVSGLFCLFVIISLDRGFYRSVGQFLSLSLSTEIWQTNAPKLFNSLHVQIISLHPPPLLHPFSSL